MPHPFLRKKRTCKRCKKTKYETFFTKSVPDRPSEYINVCTSCKNEMSKEWYKAHPDRYKRMLEKRKQKRDTDPGERYKDYKAKAKKRGISFCLSKEQFLSFAKKPCFYCGDEIKLIGIDRFDNSKGYEASNLVSCCMFCNQGKMNRSAEEYITHCEKVVTHQFLKNEKETINVHG